MTQFADLIPLARQIVDKARAANVMLATAESCTGGLVATLLTEIPGSSAVFDRGFVTYSNEAKSQMLGVAEALLAAHGAVSRPVAIAMAEGALAHSRARVSVAITGIAGPGGGSDEKPVGHVHFATAAAGLATRHSLRDYGDPGRGEIRLRAARHALELLSNSIDSLTENEMSLR